MAHKDCPVSQAQGLGGMNMQQFIEGPTQHANPYGMAMAPNGMQMGIPPQGPPGSMPQRR